MHIKGDSAEVAGWGRENEESPSRELHDIISNTANRKKGGGSISMRKRGSVSLKNGRVKGGAVKARGNSVSGNSRLAANRKLSSHASSRVVRKGVLPRISRASSGPLQRGKGANKKPTRATSLVSSRPSRRTKASRKSGKSLTSRKSKKTVGSSRRSKSSKGTSRGKNKKGGSRKHGRRAGRRRRVPFSVSVELLMERHSQGRNALIAEEEFELHNYTPLYNVLMLEMVQSQMEKMSRQQRQLAEAVQLLRDEGIPVADDDTVEQITEKLRQKLHSDTANDLQKLKEENVTLRDRLEYRALELEKKVGEVEVLRNTIAKKMAKVEVDNDAMRARVQRIIQTANLDVDKMKKELTHRIEICCSSIRTPKYGTALRSMQDLVAQVQHEIQEHRDVLCKLIVSIGAKDTFKRGVDDSETMHSNFPRQYRVDLRKLNKDHLLNVMDVLSFQDGVVETVGKALFVLNEAEYQTSVV